MYSTCSSSSTLSQILLKNSFWKVKWFSKFWSRDYFRETRNHFGRHFETVQRFIMVIISVCIYGVNIILKFRWENDFLKGGGGPVTEGRSTLCS